MSSWFGTGLSQITGQISNFTKEVLEEGTEEIDDPATQLKITRSRFIELDNYCQSQRIEIERLKSAHDEIQEKLESSELQINAISNEYREIVESKERELKDLKLEHHELYDLQSKVLSVAPGTSPPSMAHSASMPTLHTKYQSDEQDFDDVITSQHEINRLRNENRRLETEVRHWKQRGQDNTLQAAGEDKDRIQQLDTQLKELRQQYDDEIDQHQRELAALQDVHAQKLATFKRKSKDEITHLHEQLGDLQDQIQDNTESGVTVKQQREVKDRIEHLEAINQKLTVDLELTHAADREKARCLDDLSDQLRNVTKQRDQLAVSESSWLQERHDLMYQLDVVVSERRRMSQQYSELSTKLQEQTQTIKETNNTSTGPAGLVSSTPIQPGKRRSSQLMNTSDLDDLHDEPTLASDFSDLSLKNVELDNHVKTLKDQVTAYETEIGQFDLVKSDWQMEKEALEDVLLNLREQLRQREDQLNVVQAQKGLVECNKQRMSEDIDDSEGLLESEAQKAKDMSSDLDVAELSHQVELLTKGNSYLENQRDTLTVEKQNLVKLVGELREKLQLVDSKQTDQSEHKGEIQELEDQLFNKETKLSTLTSQLRQREADFLNLSTELEAKSTALTDKESAIKSLEERLATSKASTKPVEETSKETIELQNQLKQLEEERELLLTKVNAKTTELEHVSIESAQVSSERDALNEKVAGLSDQVDRLSQMVDELTKEKDVFSGQLNTLTEERNSLVESLEELDSQHEAALSQILQARDQLLQENDQLRLDLSSTESKPVAEENKTGEADELRQELNKLRSEREKVGVTLNDLHMANQELTEAKAKLKEEKKVLSNKLHEVTKDRNQLKITCDKLTQDETVATGEIKYLKAEISKAQQGTKELQTLQDQQQHEISENQILQRKIATLEEQLQNIGPDSEAFQLQLNEKLGVEVENLNKAHDIKLGELTSEINSLLKQKLDFEKELTELQQNFLDQKQNFEKYSKEIDDARKMDADGLHTEHEKLLKEAQEKDQHITDLKRNAISLMEDLTSTKKTLESTSADMLNLTQSIQQKDVEINSLSKEKLHQATVDEDQRTLITEQQAEIKRLKDIEIQFVQMTQDQEEQVTDGQIKSQGPSSNTSAIETDLEHEIVSLTQRFEEQDSKLREQKNESKSLKDTVSKYEDDITALTQDKQTLIKKVEELTKAVAQQSSSVLSQKQHMVNGEQCLENIESTVLNRERLKENKSEIQLGNVIQNGDINVDFHSNIATEELEKLKKIVSQKDSVIAQLNDNNSSLLNLLEERSQAAYGDNTLLDIHRLHSEVSNLRTEKDQMMSILNEKSRECSTLKGEVHRLMNVISAEKSALNKLQQDNQELIRAKAEPKEEPNSDMKQGAIKQLSQLIRDKDMEIEALGQKNQTLLQVLQESSHEGSQMSALISEKDNLMHQITVFQADREQIITALNTKHQESVAYHEEMQRLSSLLSVQTQDHDKLQTDYNSLKKQYEDKQQALVKMQNEMLNYKRKYSEIDVKYRDLQRRRGSSGNLTPRSPSPSLTNTTTTNMQSPLLQGPSPNSSLSNFAQEVEDLKAVIKNQEDAFIEKDRVIRSHESAIQEKDRAMWEREAALSQKDKLLSELHVKLHRTDEMVHSKDSEISANKKQAENLAFQLKGIQTEFADMRTDRDQLYERTSVLQQEIGAMKEANNRLTMSLNDKDFELRSFKEKINTLSKLLEKQGEGEKGEMDRMMKETDSLQQQTQAIKQERDQSMLALQQQQTENQQLRNEIQRLKEKGEKPLKELERLRAHLLTIEDNYTQDALGAEEREKELRNRLANAEEKAFSSSSAVQAANQQAYKQVDALQLQLHQLAEQRDDALMQLSSAQETSNQYATSLQNLQSVLEQFQIERETQMSAEIERCQRDLSAYQNENANLHDQIRQLKAEAAETTDALEAAQRLSEQLDRKEEMISALREEVQLREAELMKSEGEMNKLSSSTEAKVDKLLMKNLILGYFHAPASSRNDALRLLGRMLEFNPLELSQIGLDDHKSWFGGLFKKSNPTPPTTPRHSPNKSFSELFVTFLERESSPKPNLRLPTDRMIEESQRRHSHGHQGAPLSPVQKGEAQKHSKTTFNPFSAPMHAAMPLHVNTNTEFKSSESDHPLMNPITPSLPMFTSTASSNLLMASSSTATNSGSILRDVLQQ